MVGQKQNEKVYILVDPRNCRVRYVGRTALSIEKRIQNHMYELKYAEHDTPKLRWLRELASCGLMPIGVVVEDGRLAGPKQEELWIRLLATVGADLTNSQLRDKRVIFFDLLDYKTLNTEMHLVEWFIVAKDGRRETINLPFRPRKKRRARYGSRTLV